MSTIDFAGRCMTCGKVVAGSVGCDCVKTYMPPTFYGPCFGKTNAEYEMELTALRARLATLEAEANTCAAVARYNAALRKDVNALNSLWRESGWGQGEIDSSATIAEENEKLREALIEIANLDYMNAATNCAAYSAFCKARAALAKEDGQQFPAQSLRAAIDSAREGKT